MWAGGAAPAEEWWHEGLSEQAIQDVFDLVGAAVPFGQDQLGKNGSLAPYGVTTDLTGEIAHHMSYQEPTEDDEVDSEESLQLLTDGFRQGIQSLRGTCVISDVRLTPPVTAKALPLTLSGSTSNTLKVFRCSFSNPMKSTNSPGPSRSARLQ